MSNLNLEITSPNGVLFKGECHLAVVPSQAGDIGVMHGHEAFIASLREGKIDIYDEKQNLVKSFDIQSGFAEMQGVEKLLVLVD
jgi:F-type H+-transporting ATPase subunit epsilon